jgi:hypothetical protein
MDLGNRDLPVAALPSRRIHTRTVTHGRIAGVHHKDRGRSRVVMAMKVELRMDDPDQDWKALAKMLATRDDLRADVSLIVDPGQLRVEDAQGRLIRSLPPGKWAGDSISDIDTMLDLLAWLETEFVVRVADGRFGCPVRGWRVFGRSSPALPRTRVLA